MVCHLSFKCLLHYFFIFFSLFNDFVIYNRRLYTMFFRLTYNFCCFSTLYNSVFLRYVSEYCSFLFWEFVCIFLYMLHLIFVFLEPFLCWTWIMSLVKKKKFMHFFLFFFSPVAWEPYFQNVVARKTFGHGPFI